MGYSLKIGEYKSYVSDIGLIDDTDLVKLDNAPVEYGNSNLMQTSATAWHLFSVASGLESLFNEKVGLLINNTNIGDFVDLTSDHQRIINLAYLNKGNLVEDHQCALTWLKFWVDWAIEHCQRPVFVNQ
jgi:hypothetical protein